MFSGSHDCAQTREVVEANRRHEHPDRLIGAVLDYAGSCKSATMGLPDWPRMGHEPYWSLVVYGGGTWCPPVRLAGAQAYVFVFASILWEPFLTLCAVTSIPVHAAFDSAG
jgi:hypothetical protein